MKITELTAFNLTWEFSPVSTPSALYPDITYLNSFTYSRDILIHSIIGSGFINGSVVGAFPYGVYVLIDQVSVMTRVLNANNPVPGIIFGLTTLFSLSSAAYMEDMNGQVYYRQPIKIASGKPISVYVMRNLNVDDNGRGLFTILAEVL